MNNENANLNPDYDIEVEIPLDDDNTETSSEVEDIANPDGDFPVVFAKHIFEINGQYYLDLTNSNIIDDHIPAIFKYLSNHPEITILVLNENFITENGAAVIAQRNNEIGTVRTISLRGNVLIGDEGVISFIETNKVATAVDLSDTNVTAVGSEAIAKKNEVVTWLSLASNALGNKGVIAFLKHNKLPGIYVDLSETGIDTVGVIEIAKLDNKMVQINLSYNSDAAAKALSSCRTISLVTTKVNFLTDVGIQALRETNPVKRYFNGLQVGVNINEFPSLLRLSLFKIKTILEKEKIDPRVLASPESPIGIQFCLTKVLTPREREYQKSSIPDELIEKLLQPKV